MASISSSALAFFHDNEKPDLDSVWALVVSINQYILGLLGNVDTWNSVKLICTSKLHIQKQEFFEFSEQSAISNLYWGIDSIETAIQAKCAEEKSSQLRNSEGMLQVPALLDEHGATAGIPNRYLVCCSYFYLSVVRKLQGDEWQAALYFLQALLVSPGLVRTEVAPRLCKHLFPSCYMSELHQTGGGRSLESVRIKEFSEDNISEAMRSLASRYKYCLTYYQVMSYGETPQQHHECKDMSSLTYESQSLRRGTSSVSKSDEHRHRSRMYCKKSLQFEKVHPIDFQGDEADCVTAPHKTTGDIPEIEDEALQHLDQIPKAELHIAKPKRKPSIRYLKDMLKEYQSDATNSVDSYCNDSGEDEFKGNMEGINSSLGTASTRTDEMKSDTSDQKLSSPCSTTGLEATETLLPQVPPQPMHKEADKEYIAKFSSGRSLKSISDLDLSSEEYLDSESSTFNVFKHKASTIPDSRRFTWEDNQVCTARKTRSSSKQRQWDEVCLHSGKDSKSEILEKLENVVSQLCFSEVLRKGNEDYAVEVATIYEMLNNKAGVRDTMLKDVILDQLLAAISTSKEERAIRASVSILTTIISGNKSVIQDVRKKGLQLRDLASALKRNVDEAAVLIYLIKPSPTEMKSLELLPALVEVVCASKSYKHRPASLLLTPPAASLMIIEVLVTAFDYDTNNIHLATINSPHVLRGLSQVTGNKNLEEFISLATVLVKCMQFDGQSRKYISQFTPVAPFICLLQSNEKRAKFTALEFFHEILRMPRSSAITILQKIQKEGSMHIMWTLLICVQELQSNYQLFAANLLLQLATLENSSSKSAFREEAIQALLKSVTAEEDSAMQLLSTSILSNLGGTYAWTGKSYTAAWLVKKAGLTSLYHRNMIRNFDWLDESLQDAAVDEWCSKIARSIIYIGNSVFDALEKGLKSKTRKVSRDSLVAIAWLGFEIAKSPNSIKHSAREILLSGIEQFLYPGFELEERLLACVCIYNYASGKGMQKLIHFSEGVRESLRRFSNVTWMAEELHKVADYYLPDKSRISCVHTQILETHQRCSGAVTALIFYKGLLYSGHSDGSIKVWDIKSQAATLLLDTKEHKKTVTCFSLFEPGESLLSGSADKTIRVWQMVQRKLECIKVIVTKEQIRKLDTYGKMIFANTQGHKMKVFDSSKSIKGICKGKSVKCMTVFQGKIYIGCTNSSIQELAITTNREQVIKPPTKSWRIQSKPINSIVIYKDWLYSSSSKVEGSNIKEWRRHCEPQISIRAGKGANILGIGVVEDFIYLNCSSSTSTLQIWLRRTQQKVGRISAGSKITSLLTANDMVLCGTETGIIKGWIPI